MKGELATWLWRVGALEHLPTDIAEPYALEISGDWRGAARAWKALGCPYEQANMLALVRRPKPNSVEALAILDQLGAAPGGAAYSNEDARTRCPRHSARLTHIDAAQLTRPHEREAEILALLSEGCAIRRIAKRLFVSTKTVDHHVSAILAKLGVPSRAEAVAMARKQSEGEV
jgi:DNA-binding CsgD family transcriptional regulator